MISALNRYATPMITTFFVVSLVSGLALFFHLGSRPWHGIHEWLSLVLILPFGLHLWKNWRPMLKYHRRSPMMIAGVVAVLMCLPFFMTDTEAAAGRPPQIAFDDQVLGATADGLAPVLGVSPDGIVSRLNRAGFDLSAPDLPLCEIAALSGKSTFELSAALTFPDS